MGSGWSTTAPARTWPVASPRRCCRHPGAAGASPASWGCSRSTSSGWTRSRAQLRPRAILLGNLFRDQLDRYGELETIADRWAEVVGRPAADRAAGAQRRRPADRRSRARRAQRDVLRDRGPVGGDRRDAACLGLQALPALRRRLRLRRRLPRPPRPLPLPVMRSAAPGADDRRRADPARRHPLGRASACARRPEALEVKLPLPGLYNVYNALGAAALCLELEAGADRVVAGLARVTAAFGRAERSAGRRHRGVDPADQEPRRGQRGAAHARARGRRARPAGDPQRPHRRRQDISWVWDADFELLAPPRAHAHLRRHPRRRARAAAEVRGRSGGAVAGRPRPRRRRSTPRSPTRDRSGCSCSPHTRRCSSCARSWPPAVTSPRSGSAGR